MLGFHQVSVVCFCTPIQARLQPHARGRTPTRRPTRRSFPSVATTHSPPLCTRSRSLRSARSHAWGPSPLRRDATRLVPCAGSPPSTAPTFGGLHARNVHRRSPASAKNKYVRGAQGTAHEQRKAERIEARESPRADRKSV